MQRSYLDYAMSVIVQRALPDVRDGLKPVHRRVLYAMFDGGYRPDRGFSKCSRVVGDVMGQYHPHGDTAIYDTLVRLGQPWSLRYPLVQSQGNFGSPGDDRQAAMRYCLTGDTRIKTGEAAPSRSTSSCRTHDRTPTTTIDLKVVDRNGDPVRASKLFHSGDHPTLAARAPRGLRARPARTTTRCSALSMSAASRRCCGSCSTRSTQGDRRCAPAGRTAGARTPGDHDEQAAAIAGRRVRQRRAACRRDARPASTTPTRSTSTLVLEAYDRVVGGPPIRLDADDQVRVAACTRSTSRT